MIFAFEKLIMAIFICCHAVGCCGDSSVKLSAIIRFFAYLGLIIYQIILFAKLIKFSELNIHTPTVIFVVGIFLDMFVYFLHVIVLCIACIGSI